MTVVDGCPRPSGPRFTHQPAANLRCIKRIVNKPPRITSITKQKPGHQCGTRTGALPRSAPCGDSRPRLSCQAQLGGMCAITDSPGDPCKLRRGALYALTRIYV